MFLVKDKIIFKSTVPMKSIIRIDNPDKKEQLENLLLKEMALDKFNTLLLALPKWSVTY